MGFNCGIVGLPNVGKSTLFNALTSTVAAEAANYPFCTIEPNKGILAVPDERIDKLASIAKSEKIIPAQIEFIDIAGLVKGASKGEGLGNQFLSHIREVAAIVHVLRCFEDDDIVHVEGGVDPERDVEIVETELILADMESVERRLPALIKKANTDKSLAIELEVMQEVKKFLDQGKFAREVLKDGHSEIVLKSLNLITSKPMMYVLNVDEKSVTCGNKYTEKMEKIAKSKGFEAVIISSKIEEEIANLDNEEEKKEFLQEIGLSSTGLAKILKIGYSLLNLTTFFTIGPKEARAWTVRTGAKAPEAAGVIHTDFEKGFIRAETISYDDYIKYNGENAAKEAGRLRLEGKEYLVKDGDVFHFRFNV